MYVGQTAAAWVRQTPKTTVSGVNTNDDQVVQMLNDKTEKSPLDKARDRVLKLQESLETHFDKDKEKIMEGYLKLKMTYVRNRIDLSTEQGQLSEFSALSEQYDSVEQELGDLQQQYMDSFGERPPVTESALQAQNTRTVDALIAGEGADPLQGGSHSTLPEGEASTAKSGHTMLPAPRTEEQEALFSRINDLQGSLTELDGALSSLVEQKNQQMGYAFSPDSKDAYTRGNFIEKSTERVESLQAAVDGSAEAIARYCKRYGLTEHDMEQYLNEKNKLSSDLLLAKDDLVSLLRKEGEDDGALLDKRI